MFGVCGLALFWGFGVGGRFCGLVVVLRYFSVCFGIGFVWVLRALVLWHLVVVGLLLVGFCLCLCV